MILTVIGFILIAVGFLGLLHLISLGLTTALIVIIVGVLFVIFNERGRFISPR